MGAQAVRLREHLLPAGPGAPTALGSPRPVGCAVITQTYEAAAFGPCLSLGCPESRARGGPGPTVRGAGLQEAVRGAGEGDGGTCAGRAMAAHGEGSWAPHVLLSRALLRLAGWGG